MISKRHGREHEDIKIYFTIKGPIGNRTEKYRLYNDKDYLG